MSHTEEQLEIIRRMKETSKLFAEAVEQQQAMSRAAAETMITAGHPLVMAGQALVRSMERLRVSSEKTDEIILLNQQHGELFRQYLDTIIKGDSR